MVESGTRILPSSRVVSGASIGFKGKASADTT